MIMKPNLTLAGYILSDLDGNIKYVPERVPYCGLLYLLHLQYSTNPMLRHRKKFTALVRHQAFSATDVM